MVTFDFSEKILDFGPNLLAAFLFLLLGIVLGKILEILSKEFLKKLKIDQLFRILNFDEKLKRLGFKSTILDLFGEFLKWALVLFFLILAFDVLGWEKAGTILEKVLGYFPNIFVAFLIFLAASFLSFLSQKLLFAKIEEKGIVYSKFFNKTTNALIWILAILAILYQLKIVPALILTIFAGVVGAVSLALGIGFGLGAKDFAQKFLKELEEKFK